MVTNANTPNNHQKKYRPCVGITLFNSDDKVFVGERIDTPGAWQMPQGGVDPGEDIKQAALREMKEEIGTDKAEIIRIAERTIRYDLPADITNNWYDGKYRGQEQTWVALRFNGQDLDINLNAFEHPEFSAWQWVPLKKVPELIVPFKRNVYTQVAEMFGDITLTD